MQTWLTRFAYAVAVFAALDASAQALVKELAVSKEFRKGSGTVGLTSPPQAGRCVVASVRNESGASQVIVVSQVAPDAGLRADSFPLHATGTIGDLALEPSGSILIAMSDSIPALPGTHSSVALRLARLPKPEEPPAWISQPVLKCGYLYSVKLFTGPSQQVYVVSSFADAKAANIPSRKHICEVNQSGMIVWERTYPASSSFPVSRVTMLTSGVFLAPRTRRSAEPGGKSGDREGAFLDLLVPRSNENVGHAIDQLETIRCMFPRDESEVIIAGELPLDKAQSWREFGLLRRTPSRQTVIMRYNLDNRSLETFPVKRSHPRVEERISDLIPAKRGYAALFTVTGTADDTDRGVTRSMNQERALWWRLLDDHGDTVAEAELVRAFGGIAYRGRLVAIDPQTYVVTCAVEGRYVTAGRMASAPSDKPDMLLLQVKADGQ